MPPYNKNLYVGELKDEDSGDEYVVLVRGYSDGGTWHSTISHR